MEEIKLIITTKKGTSLKVPASISREDGRIFFLKSPFALKNEIKAMQGSKWHGFIEGDERKIWSVADSIRNNFQLDYMQGGDPYANWDRPLQHWEYKRPLFEHQKLMVDHCLTYHYKILAAEMGTGKSLAAIEIMELSGIRDWWWVAPKSGIAAVDRELVKWSATVEPRLLTYDRLRIEIEQWKDGHPAPQGVIFDESSRLKTGTAKRTKAAQHLADSIRLEYGWDGFVIPMSGSPSPKSPVDWHAQAEICYPGFLREGSAKAFEMRMAFYAEKHVNQDTFWVRTGWKDDELKCDQCGECEDHENHIMDDIFGGVEGAHEHIPSKNEVAYLYQRLDGLVLPLAKKDCLDLPEKTYREVILEPTSTLKRVAKGLIDAAPTAIQGLTWLRELSDGFQYRNVQKGVIDCPVCGGGSRECEGCGGEGKVPNMVRETKQINTPKDRAVIDLLDENEDQSRIVFFAGFQGSIDRIIATCHKQQWNVVKVDGRGWKIMPCNDQKVPRDIKPLDYWADLDNPRVAFVAHPMSGGMGLTLTEARMSVFYSNDFSPESRTQAEDRIHRPGMDTNRGATIVDLFHLGTDRRVLDVLKDNRRLEQMTLSEVRDAL